jgi:hypothetical protein
MSEYVMTPARRAALRKAQLISARRRRRHSPLGYAAHDTRQRIAIAYREGQLQRYRTADQRAIHGQKVKQLPKKAAKRTGKYVLKRAAIGTAKAGLTLGAATAIGYTAYGMSPRGKLAKEHKHLGSHLSSGKTVRVHSTRGPAVFGTPTKSLGMGPKGRATVRQRGYRAKKRGR